jgi:hypothetical protein
MLGNLARHRILNGLPAASQDVILVRDLHPVHLRLLSVKDEMETEFGGSGVNRLGNPRALALKPTEALTKRIEHDNVRQATPPPM